MTPVDRPKLLFLCQTLPYPPDGGVQIRAFHLLRILAQQYEVHALCFYRRATRPDQRSIEEALNGLEREAGLASVAAFPIPQEYSRVRLLWDHLRSVAKGRAYTVYAHASSDFSAALREILAHYTFDLVHMDSLDLSNYLDELEGQTVVCDHHNVESVLLLRRAKQASNPILARYIRHQASLVRRAEIRWCGRVALNILVSDPDRETLTAAVPTARTIVVPNGVDTRSFTQESGGTDGIVFVGGYNWFPNRDGMEYFAEDILPLLRLQTKSTPVVWVGRSPPEVVHSYAATFGIELTGYVDDIRPYVARAACFIVPLRVGGGTRLKILDAWSMGKAVVSTSAGCEGLEARDGENILIRDSPDQFASAVAQVLEDAELRKRLGSQGRETAEQIYDWDRVGEHMLAAFRKLPRGD